MQIYTKYMLHIVSGVFVAMYWNKCGSLFLSAITDVPTSTPGVNFFMVCFWRMNVNYTISNQSLRLTRLCYPSLHFTCMLHLLFCWFKTYPSSLYCLISSMYATGGGGGEGIPLNIFVKWYSQPCLRRICWDWRNSFNLEKNRLMRG